MSSVGTVSRGVLRCGSLFLWALLGAWTACAAFFTIPLPVWFSIAAAVAIALVFCVSLRERWLVAGPAETTRGKIRLSLLAIVIAVAVAAWFCTRVPDANQDWAADHQQMPIVRMDGDKVRIKNVRNFTWRTPTDFTAGFCDRTYDVSKINSMHYLIVPLRGIEMVAHVFVCFGFSDGQYVAVSIEGRRVEGRPYQVIPSMFQQYQLIYVVGDERDVVGKRGAIWKNPVRFYPAASTDERKRALFVDMMRRANHLEYYPEFYHLLTNNCMNNLTDHLRCLGGRPLPSDLRLLLTGWSDRLAYDYGYIDTDLPFDQARDVFLIDDCMRTTPLDETFSKRLREMLDQRVAAARQALGLP